MHRYGISHATQASPVKSKIAKLQTKITHMTHDHDDASTSEGSSTIPLPDAVGRAQLRSSVSPMKWTSCIFCQDPTVKEKIILVQTKLTSVKIIEAAKYDQQIQLRLAGVNDLIADEGKYHLRCYSKFIRETDQIKNSECSQTVDVAMQWVVNQLHHSTEQGHVLEVSKVWH